MKHLYSKIVRELRRATSAEIICLNEGSIESFTVITFKDHARYLRYLKPLDIATDFCLINVSQNLAS